MHDLVERSPVEPLERPERPVGRVAEREEVGEEMILRETEDLPSKLLILHDEWHVPTPRSAAASIISIVA